MRNAKTSKAMALVVLLMLIILCLSAFSFASSATSGVAENSTGVMGDVISKPVSNAMFAPHANNVFGSNTGIAYFFSSDTSQDYIQMVYPKKITVVAGDAMEKMNDNGTNAPRNSHMYGKSNNDWDSPSIYFRGHYGDTQPNYETVVHSALWGWTNDRANRPLTGTNNTFFEVFSDYKYTNNVGVNAGTGAVGWGNEYTRNSWDGAYYNGKNNCEVFAMTNNSNHDGINVTIWPCGTSSRNKVGDFTFTAMPEGGNSFAWFQHKSWNGGWGTDRHVNTYFGGVPTIQISILDPSILDGKLAEAERIVNSITGIVSQQARSDYDNLRNEVNTLKTNAYDYTKNFGFTQAYLVEQGNRLVQNAQQLKNTEKFGIVNNGQYCTMTELRISIAQYEKATDSQVLATLYNDTKNTTETITKTSFTKVSEPSIAGGGYYKYVINPSNAEVAKYNMRIKIESTGETRSFVLTTWHGYASESGAILSDLSKLKELGQVATCAGETNHCRLKVHSLSDGSIINCNCTWTINGVGVKTNPELWAHSYNGSNIETIHANCVDEGHEYEYCAHCDDREGSKRENKVLPINPEAHKNLGGSWVWVAGQKVPGTETELTEAMHCGYAGKYGHLCSACNNYANEVEKAAGIGANDEPILHVADTSNAQVDNAPTCCEFGTGHYDCQNCGLKARDLTEEEIRQESKLQPTNNHVWKSEYFIEKKPTCTENAVAYYQCSNEKCTATTTDGIDFETDINVKALGHDMHFEIKTEATCYSTGYQIEKCHRDGCNATGKEEQIDTKAHEIDREHKHNEIAPTCKDDGSYEYRCKWYNGVNCTEKEVITAATDESLAANGIHTRPSEDAPGYLEITKHPNCTENGVGHYVCTVCQTHVQLDPANEPKLQAKGHSWTDAVEETYIKTPADCTNAAVYYKSCSVCKEKHASETFVSGEALGHSFTKYVSNDNATCHSNATETAKCDREGCQETHTREIENSKTDHQLELKVDKQPTCVDKGTGHYECINDGCGYVDNNSIEIEAKGHTWADVVEETYIKTPADCTNAAVYYKSCSVCKEKHASETFVSGEALGHNFTKYVSNDNATCHSNATETAKCDREGCQETHTREIENSKTDHQLELKVDKQPTCVDKGTGHYECINDGCGYVDNNSIEIEAKGHTWADVVEETYIKTPADCTNAAVYYKSCSVCKEKHASETFVHGNPLGHTWENIVEEQYIKTHANCTNAAVYYKTCSVCKGKDENETFEHGEPLGHKWVFTTVDEPTCYLEGSGKDICETCKAEGELKPIAKIDHVYDESIKHNEIAKTCTKDGSYEFYCKNHGHCGAVKTITAADDETLKATGHNVEGQQIIVHTKPTCHSLGEGYRLCTNENCDVEGKKVWVEDSEAETAEELKLRDHVLDNIKHDYIQATCTKNGSANFYCKERDKGCNYQEALVPTKENGLLAIGHIYNSAKLNVDVLATCMEEGKGHQYCTNPNCDDKEGSKKVVTLPIDNKNHVFDESKGSKRGHQDGVCADPKSSYDYLTCANEKCLGVTQKIEGTEQAGEHRWSTRLTTTKKPTCHTEGEGHYKCTKCSKTKQAVVSETPELQKLSHKYVETVDDKYQKSPATCESPAVYYKSCSACGDKHETETFVSGSALEHDWKFTETVVPSLENETDGYDLYTCSLCGETKKENIVKWETLIPEPEPPKFTVTIEGGTADGQTTVQVNANGTVTVKAEVPEGKVFVGWSDGNNIISYKAEDTIQVTGDMTLTAIYEDVVVENNETANNNSAVLGGAIGGTVVALLLVGIIIAIVVIVKKRKA